MATASALPARLPLIAPRDALLLRICATANADQEPGFRATRRYRFDDPDGKFATLYCAASFETCYCETVVRNRPIDPLLNHIPIPRAEHDARSLSLILVNWSLLRMVHLCDDGAHRLGLDAALSMGADYEATQALARALHDHPDLPHGAVYRSRFSMSALAVVLFGHARPRVRLYPTARPVPLSQLNEAFLALTTMPLPLALV